MAIGKQVIQEFWRRSAPLYEYAGLIVESAENGVYRCRMPLNERTGNHMNTVHAAVQWAAAEVLGGIAGVAVLGTDLENFYGAVRSVSIEFLKPARTAIIAETLFGEREAIRLKRLLSDGAEATWRLSAEIRDESGDIVATSEAEYIIRPWRAA
ncbi:conserved hypothetical protein [Candidatus Desulfarcum epimagneticum]|uniref:Thioesterase n=1 Tax=uncultured Desulfobacteraceae bacterium TaxID=218296 RepID=A0A484HCJ4_9BACT|nr:conserved hypothetical protein [uncultured Desulfobacteraceae bacterium]